jgi:hypothetical protein
VTHLSANGFNDSFARRPTLPFNFKSYVHLSHDRSYAFASFRDLPNKPLEWTGHQNLHGLYPILFACHSGAAFGAPTTSSTDAKNHYDQALGAGVESLWMK